MSADNKNHWRSFLVFLVVLGLGCAACLYFAKSVWTSQNSRALEEIACDACLHNLAYMLARQRAEWDSQPQSAYATQADELEHMGKCQEASKLCRLKIKPAQLTPQDCRKVMIVFCRCDDFAGAEACGRQFMVSHAGSKDILVATIKDMLGPIADTAATGKNASDRDYMARNPKLRCHWPDTTKPIRVCLETKLEDPHWHDINGTIARQCFGEWAEAAGGQIHFDFSAKPDNAMIRLSWLPARQELYTAGSTALEGQENILKRATISIPLSSTGTGDDESAFHMKAVILHEVGHAFGLPHSTNIRDVMFPAETGIFAQLHGLSARDKATIKALYARNQGH